MKLCNIHELYHGEDYDCPDCVSALRTRVDSLTEINLINEDVIQGQSDKITALREVVEKARKHSKVNPCCDGHCAEILTGALASLDKPMTAEEVPQHCGQCGEVMEVVRPGKWQCDCQPCDKCGGKGIVTIKMKNLGDYYVEKIKCDCQGGE